MDKAFELVNILEKLFPGVSPILAVLLILWGLRFYKPALSRTQCDAIIESLEKITSHIKHHNVLAEQSMLQTRTDLHDLKIKLDEVHTDIIRGGDD